MTAHRQTVERHALRQDDDGAGERRHDVGAQRFPVDPGNPVQKGKGLSGGEKPQTRQGKLGGLQLLNFLKQGVRGYCPLMGNIYFANI